MAATKRFGNYLIKQSRFFLLVVLAVLMMSCAASKKQVAGTGSTKETLTNLSIPFDETFDPLSLEDDDIEIKRTSNSANATKTNLQDLKIEHPTATKQEPLPDSLISYKEADGFRVQIFAGRNVEAATMTKNKAQVDFAPYGQKVYFIFEAPFYKVRIGDFLMRSKADQARELARQLGYREAFVVRSKIRIPENSNQ